MSMEFLMPTAHKIEGCGLSVCVFGLDKNLSYNKILIYLKNNKENAIEVNVDSYNTIQTESVSFDGLEKDRYYSVVAELYYDNGTSKTIEHKIPSVEVSGYGISLFSSSDGGSGGQPTGGEVAKPSKFIPPTYGQINPIYTTIKDQDIYQSCVANSLSTAMSIFKAKQADFKEDYSVSYIYGSDNRPNEEYMYFEEAIQKCMTYGSPRWELFIGVKQDDLLKEAACEQFNKSQSDTRVVQNARKQRFSNYKLVNFYDCDTVASYIDTYGYFMFNFKIPNNFYNIDHSGIVPQPDGVSTFNANMESGSSSSSQYAGANHSIALIGLTEIDGEPYWMAQNSWGNSWGNNGLCFIPCDWGYNSSEYWALESYGIVPGGGYTDGVNPTGPYNLTKTQSGTQVSLSWDTNESDAEYIVFCRKEYTLQWERKVTTSSTAATIDIKDDSITYEFMVMTMLNYYCSETATTQQILEPEIDFIDIGTYYRKNDGSIDVKFDCGVYNVYTDITTLEIQVKEINTTEWVSKLLVTASDLGDENLSFHSYYYDIYKIYLDNPGNYDIKLKVNTSDYIDEKIISVIIEDSLYPIIKHFDCWQLDEYIGKEVQLHLECTNIYEDSITTYTLQARKVGSEKWYTKTPYNETYGISYAYGTFEVNDFADYEFQIIVENNGYTTYSDIITLTVYGPITLNIDNIYYYGKDDMTIRGSQTVNNEDSITSDVEYQLYTKLSSGSEDDWVLKESKTSVRFYFAVNNYDVYNFKIVAVCDGNQMGEVRTTYEVKEYDLSITNLVCSRGYKSLSFSWSETSDVNNRVVFLTRNYDGTQMIKTLGTTYVTFNDELGLSSENTGDLTEMNFGVTYDFMVRTLYENEYTSNDGIDIIEGLYNETTLSNITTAPAPPTLAVSHDDGIINVDYGVEAATNVSVIQFDLYNNTGILQESHIITISDGDQNPSGVFQFTNTYTQGNYHIQAYSIFNIDNISIQCITSDGENYVIGYITIASGRPEDWIWTTAIKPGIYTLDGKNVIAVTATEWNEFTKRINAFRAYALGRGLTVGGNVEYTFTPVSSGMEFTKEIYNEAVDALNSNYNGISGYCGLINKISTGTELNPSLFTIFEDEISKIP